LFDYTVTVDDTVDTVVVAVAARSTAAIAAQLGASNDTAAAFSQANTAVAADPVALAAFSTALNAGGATATRLANQVTLPADTLGATTAAVLQTGGSTISVVGGRQASTRIGQQFAAANGTGFSSGNHGKHSAFWAKGFGSLASQRH
jgi:hypothetical protein